MTLRTCVSSDGRFVTGIHRPGYRVLNLRRDRRLSVLGSGPDGTPIDNTANFPMGDLVVDQTDPVIEIANPFPFRGATYIIPRFADRCADDPPSIAMAAPPSVSLNRTLTLWHRSIGELTDQALSRLYEMLPLPLQLAVATTSTDPSDLEQLAAVSARFQYNPGNGRPVGLAYQRGSDGDLHPEIHHRDLFKAVANNPHLPEDYKHVMVLKPGAQGGSEIVGDWHRPDTQSRVFEYLRRNSYIPWGHYAANMADDAVRYRPGDLQPADITGMRHLYYQRTYVRMAAQLGIAPPPGGGPVEARALESLRRDIVRGLQGKRPLPAEFDAELWGWNFGFDLSPSGYRLHGSHQQVHQQYALIPRSVVCMETDTAMDAYSSGDLVQDFVHRYRQETGSGFFDCYLDAIRNNRRTDGRRDLNSELVVFENAQVMLFVPKAQTSQWELQLMPKSSAGNVLEAGTDLRQSLDRAIWIALRVLARIGARMVTAIEYAKRFSRRDSDQRLLYCFLPKLPPSPGAFSEAQLRWINGHYPEDFAALCRIHLGELTAHAAAAPDDSSTADA